MSEISLKKRFIIVFCSLVSFIFPSDGVILTIPKSGTHFLGKVLESLTGKTVVYPSSTHFIENEKIYRERKDVLLIAHANPGVLKEVSQDRKVLLLVRDPRDVTLSMIDDIDKRGVNSWPGLGRVISQKSWNGCSPKEKISYILDRYYTESESSVKTLFQSAIQLHIENKCSVIKYELLSPEIDSYSLCLESVDSICNFLSCKKDNDEKILAIRSAYKNKDSRTLNKGNAFRYKNESDELISWLTEELKEFIVYFEYSL